LCHALRPGTGGREWLEPEVPEADPDGHHVVDLVRDAAGQLADRLQPLGLSQLLLHPLEAADLLPRHDGASDRSLPVANRAGTAQQRDTSAIGTAERPLFVANDGAVPYRPRPRH